MQANILTTLKPFIRLLIASIFAIIITLLLLSFMHFLLGGFNSDDNYFTRLFTLKTVVLPKENTRPTKPARVRAQPDTTGPQEDNVKEETEAYLSDQKLQAGDISAPAIKPETAKPKLQPGAEAENLSDKREKIISILEGEEE